jgi:hypothetical protein
MAKLDIIDRSGGTAAQVDLPESVFSQSANDHLIYEAVVNIQANRRQGNAATKTRAEVRGGGKKPWRQKGTGRARVGSTRSPLWKKGGTVFGPQPRDYSYELPKKVKRGPSVRPWPRSWPHRSSSSPASSRSKSPKPRRASPCSRPSSSIRPSLSTSTITPTCSSRSGTCPGSRRSTSPGSTSTTSSPTSGWSSAAGPSRPPWRD